MKQFVCSYEALVGSMLIVVCVTILGGFYWYNKLQRAQPTCPDPEKVVSMHIERDYVDCFYVKVPPYIVKERKRIITRG